MRLSFAAPVLKGGHEVIAELWDQSGSARIRMRHVPDAEGMNRDPRRSLERSLRSGAFVNETGEKDAFAPEPPRRAHHASVQPVGKGLVMKKILGLALVAMRSLALAAPVSAGRRHGGGFQRVDAPAERRRETAGVVPSPAATK